MRRKAVRRRDGNVQGRSRISDETIQEHEGRGVRADRSEAREQAEAEQLGQQEAQERSSEQPSQKTPSRHPGPQEAQQHGHQSEPEAPRNDQGNQASAEVDEKAQAGADGAFVAESGSLAFPALQR